MNKGNNQSCSASTPNYLFDLTDILLRKAAIVAHLQLCYLYTIVDSTIIAYHFIVFLFLKSTIILFLHPFVANGMTAPVECDTKSFAMRLFSVQYSLWFAAYLTYFENATK